MNTRIETNAGAKLSWTRHGTLAWASLAALAVALSGAVQWSACAGERLTLKEAIAEARRNSPDIAIAQSRIRESAAGVRQADAALWPRLNFQSSYSRTDNPIGVFGAALNQRSFGPGLNFNDVPDADNLLLRGVVTAPLYTGGQISSARKAARETSAAARHSAEAVANRMAFEVTRTFYSIAKTEAFVGAIEASIRAFEGNVSIARKRFDAGKALKTDVLDLEVRLARAEADLVDARNANELTRRALANLLGRDSAVIQVEVPGDMPAVLGNESRGLRPELAAVARHGTAAEAAVRQARSGFRPKVSAFFNGDHNRGWKFDGNGDSYTVGFMADWKLWDGFLTRGKVDEARARVATVREEERRLRLAIDFEVQRSRLNLRAAEERSKASVKAVTLAEESVKLTRVRFEQGLALSSQLIDAETVLTESRVRLAQSRADRNIANAAQRHALGLPQIESTGGNP